MDTLTAAGHQHGDRSGRWQAKPRKIVAPLQQHRMQDRAHGDRVVSPSASLRSPDDLAIVETFASETDDPAVEIHAVPIKPAVSLRAHARQQAQEHEDEPHAGDDILLAVDTPRGVEHGNHLVELEDLVLELDVIFAVVMLSIALHLDAELLHRGRPPDDVFLRGQARTPI